MNRLTLTISVVALGATFASGCLEKLGDDCKNTATCPHPDGTGGSDSTGGQSSEGGAGTGNAPGDGDGDTGGTGGTADPCDACGDPTPECNPENECVECLGDEHCLEEALGKCNVTPGECVACLDNGDCGADAPVCLGNECTPCTGNLDCEGRSGATVCEMGSGACVECLPSEDDRTSDTDACGTNICNPQSLECESGLSQATKDICDACISDSECLTGQNCIPLQYSGGAEPVELGGFCMKIFPGCTAPYEAGAINRTSLSGAPATAYCGLAEEFTTCAAIGDLKAGTVCTENLDCGTEHGEGRCEVVNGGGETKCTYSCTGSAQCVIGFACDGVVGDEYCGG